MKDVLHSFNRDKLHSEEPTQPWGDVSVFPKKRLLSLPKEEIIEKPIQLVPLVKARSIK